MSHQIRVPEHLWVRLQALAIPLLDTEITVLEKLLDFYEQKHASNTPKTDLELDPERPQSLTHTRVESAKFCGQTAKNWNELVYVAHRFAFQSVGSFAALKSVTRANIAQGIRTKSGYHPIAEIGISIQNVDSNQAWRNVLHLAKNLKGQVEVRFRWLDKESAAHPGKTAVMRWPAV